MVSSSDWLAIATSILAAVSALSVVVSWRENKKNRKLAALERRNNNFYSPLFLLLQSIGYNVENKNNLQKNCLTFVFQISSMWGQRSIRQ